MSSELKEILNARNGLLFCEEELSPVFCKPKLIPLKSVTLEKLEKMQSEAMEMMKKKGKNNNETPRKENTEYTPSKFEGSTADIWTAEEDYETTTKTV
ncbi:hypothetical protein LOAG_02680 [Loa loa]|uniref:BBSome-interacting protein 1 n=1 Tax=Loa loa TaxID=7209 RepID=A0A1I7V9T0_LOALO|nr:hypothetical protein LOAG_02680 [Loa loa]EFO25809.1 hypothetical protein LOAG_02680 [Loa loa]